jgi:putative protease
VQLREIELLAPAKNRDIGIAAIDCGADSLYIAGPSFGAREAAGNSVSDVAQLAAYGRKFGAKVYMVINTILYDNEIDKAVRLAHQAYDAGCSALIIQDLGLLKAGLPPLPLFASTQTNIRTVEQAMFLESLGFERLILARELSLGQIAEIRKATTVELESFIHGALCVSYSGQCYMSEKVAGRSANRGACVQACRSKYDLKDSSGKILVRDKALLSLRDLNLGDYIPQLANAGVSSFKVEGRLKNISYIKNVVRFYRSLIDNFIEKNGGYYPSSSGKLYGGFTPRPEKTFNRGYTHLFIDGERGEWRSKEAAKAVGEYVGKVSSIVKERGSKLRIKYESNLRIENGDGLCFITPEGEVEGARANVTEPGVVIINDQPDIIPGTKVYRNYDHNFEKELESNMPRRLIAVTLKFSWKEGITRLEGICEDGTEVLFETDEKHEAAKNRELAQKNIINQLSKRTDIYIFNLSNIEGGEIPFYPLSLLNEMRRTLAMLLNEKRGNREDVSGENKSKEPASLPANLRPLEGKPSDYRANISNKLSEKLYKELGSLSVDPAFEIAPPAEAELMRCKYCIKYELGLCPKEGGGKGLSEPLYLTNGGREFRLGFDCKNCEMVIFG